MLHIITEIENYIQFLMNNYNLKITLHPKEGECFISQSSLIKYNIHTSPYCIYLKTNPEIWEMCINNQSRIKNTSKRKNPFTGVCCFGVKERVYALFYGDDYLGFVSVSGYRAESGDEYADKISACYGLNKKILNSTYSRFKENIPDESELDTLLIPLCRMIEYGNMLYKESLGSGGGLYLKLLSYINNHFLEDISVESLSREFSVSASLVSHCFKKNKGKSIREYISFLRIDFSKALLKCTDASITEIAYMSGFGDASYYINSFKKLCGMTPGKYRKCASE